MNNNQVQVYSVNVNSFVLDKNKEVLINEEIINNVLMRLYFYRKLIKEFILIKFISNNKEKSSLLGKNFHFDNICDYFTYRGNKNHKKKITALIKKAKKMVNTKQYNNLLKGDKLYKSLEKSIKESKRQLKLVLENENNKKWVLNPKKISKYNIVSLFDSFLIRTLKLEYNQLTTDLIIVKIFYYSFLKQLLKYGFDYQGEHYIFFSASAGQIRKKKIIMIKESAWKQIANTIMCGLSNENINESQYKGCNINKFLAYLALCTSATNPWNNFDIDKSIVIDDFETEDFGKVDFIDKTKNEAGLWQLSKPVKKPMNVKITHSDGCGWILPSESKKNFMVRLPWVKGLMTPVDYLKFCRECNNGNYKVKDIYGKEWDLLKDDIRYVFSKSQFKMHKYYNSWQEYKDNFKKYNCHASICNKEPDAKDFKKKSFNYQMWQTLTDITDDEIDYFIYPIVDYFSKVYKDRDTMLDILGASKNNKKNNFLQQALEIYPELLNDNYVKEQLSDIINSRKKEAKAGKFKIEAKNTFFIPDTFAWMEYSLAGVNSPEGLLKNGEVSCRLYKKEPKLLVNRSPHLYQEHGVRKNAFCKDINKWFITNGVYTSCHDLLSKILMFDVDGDPALVVADHTLINIAEDNMIGVIPLYYKMGTAEPEEINSNNIYDSLINAFEYGNIGKYSNKLTALWNTDNPNLELIKLICAMNNYSIDAAKTLEMPVLEPDMQKQFRKKSKMPYFFQFAKDYDGEKVEALNGSTVNRICENIESIKQDDFDFSKVGKFRYTYLMSNKKIEINPVVIEKYDQMNEEMQKYFIKNKNMKKEDIKIATWDILRYDFSLFCKEKNVEYEDAVDMIIKYIYTKKRNNRKAFLFNVFGDVIVQNLKNNISKSLEDGYILCSNCGSRTKKISPNQKMCSECAEKIEKEKAKLRMQKYRASKVS